MTIIQDGAGTGNTAKVTVENMLRASAVNTPIILHQVEKGLGFNINTGTLVLTDATADTAVLYLKNTDVNGIVITSVTISTAASTAGTSDTITLKQVGGFTAASDIIANGTAGVAVNRNRGTSQRIFDGVVTIGGTGRSFTDEVAAQQTLGIFTVPRTFELTTIIPVGGEVGVTVSPPASNTSMPFMLSVNFHIETDE